MYCASLSLMTWYGEGYFELPLFMYPIDQHQSEACCNQHSFLWTHTILSYNFFFGYLGEAKKVQFYAAHSYVSQFSSEEEYVELQPTIILYIVNYVLFPNKSHAVSHHQILDKHTREHDLQDMSYVFIELPKFCKKQEELVTVQDKWIYFFKNKEHSLEVLPAIYEKEILEAYRSMEEFNWIKGELEAYLKG